MALIRTVRHLLEKGRLSVFRSNRTVYERFAQLLARVFQNFSDIVGAMKAFND